MNKLDQYILNLLKKESIFAEKSIIDINWIRCVEYNQKNIDVIIELINNKNVQNLKLFEEFISMQNKTNDIYIYKIKTHATDYIILVKDYFELNLDPIVLKIIEIKYINS